MKKLLCAAFAVLFLLSACGCGKAVSKKARVSITATTFPVYDLAREIIGNADGVSLTLLLKSGADPHNFQPTAADMVTIASSDIFIYIGGESDAWAEDTLKTVAGENVAAVNLTDRLGGLVKKEEHSEGMQEEHSSEEHKEEENDEHIWLSLKNAAAMCDIICDELCCADPNLAEHYRTQNESFKKRLSELDGEYENAVKSAARDTLIFADRFPFLYLLSDYSLNFYAAFPGCSAESEASFKTVTFLAQKADELGISHILIIDGSNGKIAETVIENTKRKNAKILRLDSMQSVSLKDSENGVTYLSVMQKNLSVLKEALS